MAASIIKYALDKSGNAIFIDNADNGLSCGCKCAKCGKDMIAVQGEARKKEWHFRHHEETDCLGGQETAIHKMAKQIIVANTKILAPKGILEYTQAQSEIPFDSIVPDVTASISDYKVHFEITVTHGIDEIKRIFYTNGKHRSIEIDLSNISYDVSPSDLENLVLQQTHNKKYIFWPQPKVDKEDDDGSMLVKALLFIAGIFFLGKLFSRK